MYFANTAKNKRSLHATLQELPISKMIGVTTGCFDILHPLHIQYLQKCRAECDILVVGVDCDILLTSNKGKASIMSEDDRAYMVSSLEVVDLTFVMDSLPDLVAVLRTLKGRSNNRTDIELYKSKEMYYDNPVLRFDGVTTVILPDVYPVSSTTELVRHIQNTYQKL